jgi:hypothetical protein
MYAYGKGEVGERNEVRARYRSAFFVSNYTIFTINTISPHTLFTVLKGG